MNHETTIKRIQELVPDLGEDLYRCNRVWEAWQMRTMSEYDFEVVDKPITIAVIMLAIATEYNPKNTSTFLNIDSNGEFCWTTTTDLRGGTMKIIEPIISWNLSKDNFNDQSEETKTFIGELLDKK